MTREKRLVNICDGCGEIITKSPYICNICKKEFCELCTTKINIIIKKEELFENNLSTILEDQNIIKKFFFICDDCYSIENIRALVKETL